MSRSSILLALLLLAPVLSRAQTPRVVVEVEAGPAWQSYNDVQIPNAPPATRFSLTELAGSGPVAAGRLLVTWNVNERHGLRFLAAPFMRIASGVSDRPLVFAGETYAADVPIEAVYGFDSWRLTYRYRVRAGERATAWVGGTAKLRDAIVELRQGETRSRKVNVGFVPLLHGAVDWRLAARWRLALDADALAGGPGRAIDAALKLGYDTGGPWLVQAGYRTLEGGADVDEVYGFAWLHYAVVSVSWRR
ncbi:MAG TPA: hypothetical protein VEA99_02840 [Gemmatimonadaceae bacterium]|nr:hypothetical protein [Gemmatimonadaceae bacterium]